MLRRYIPKGNSIDLYVGKDITKVMNFVNSYARNIYSKTKISNVLSV